MSETKINKIWPGWQVEGVLGAGAFGTVYLIRGNVDDNTVFSAAKVIKVPPTEDAVANAEKMGISRDLLATYFGKFKNDLNWELTMYRTMSSPHLAPVEDIVVEDENGPGWTGYVRTGIYTPLATYFDKAPAGEEDAARIGNELATALHKCEEYSMVHGEIKPENVMVTDTGAFVLVDFGVRRCLEKAGTGIFGENDSAFMAPELAEEKKYTAASDIYSLGMLMRYIAGGCVLPADGSTEDLDKMDAGLAAVIRKAAAADPAERYSSAAEMHAEIAKLPLGKKAPRRAMAAAAAFDTVKKNGGAIRNTGAAAAVAAGKNREETPAQTKTEVKSEHAEAKKKNSGKKKTAIAIAVIAILAVIALLVALAVRDGMKDKPDDGEKDPVLEDNEQQDNETPDDKKDEENEDPQLGDDEKDTDSEKDPETGTPDDPANPDDGKENDPVQDPNENDPVDDPVTPPDDDPVTPSDDDPVTPPIDDPVTPPVDDPVTPPVDDRPEPTNNDTLFPSDSELITAADMEGMTRSETYMLINEIYARHGKIFKTESIQDYFESQIWYEPVTTSSIVIEGKFSTIERTNLDTIIEYQKEQGHRPGGTTTAPDTQEPDPDDNTGSETTPDTGDDAPTRPEPTNNDILFPSDTTLITAADMEGMTRSETYMLINEIYARHGKIFTDATVQAYFDSQVWYTPISKSYAAAEGQFNDVEWTNIRAIIDFQTQMGYKD